MQWYTQNPEMARPVAVCLLLVAGAVLAEAVIPSGDIEAARGDNAVIYETNLDFSKRTAGGNANTSSPSPYFDQNDPAD